MRRHVIILGLLALTLAITGTALAGGPAKLDAGSDFVSRYVWRGMDAGNSACFQPSATLSKCGFELGMWGSYPLANDAAETDEIDFWLGYTFQMENGWSITGTATDYYYPNGGHDFFDFDADDALDSTLVITDNEETGIPDSVWECDQGGAHTVELGLAIAGPESFPMTLSAFMNVHNDAGNNVYFQADYATQVGGTALNLFAGFTPGSEDNLYYGTDEFALINVGFQVDRKIKMTSDFSLPVFLNFSLNPDAEIAFLYFGFSL